MTKKYIMLGNGGHANVCRDVAQKNGFEEIGYVLNDKSDQAGSVQNTPFLGCDDWLLDEKNSKPWLINGVGGSPQSSKRADIFKKYSSNGFKFLTLAHPSAQLAGNIILREGVQIMAGTTIQPNCLIDENTIINTAASIDHDCSIGKHVQISPGSILCGGVTIGSKTFVGAGSCIIPEIKIGSDVIIGAGSTVLRNIKNSEIFIEKKS